MLSSGLLGSDIRVMVIESEKVNFLRFWSDSCTWIKPLYSDVSRGLERPPPTQRRYSDLKCRIHLLCTILDRPAALAVDSPVFRKRYEISFRFRQRRARNNAEITGNRALFSEITKNTANFDDTINRNTQPSQKEVWLIKLTVTRAFSSTNKIHSDN